MVNRLFERKDIVCPFCNSYGISYCKNFPVARSTVFTCFATYYTSSSTRVQYTRRRTIEHD